MTSPALHPPGSQAARDAGCSCPIVDNHYGRGIDTGSQRLFVYSEGCPYHFPTRAA